MTITHPAVDQASLAVRDPESKLYNADPRPADPSERKWNSHSLFRLLLRLRPVLPVPGERGSGQRARIAVQLDGVRADLGDRLSRLGAGVRQGRAGPSRSAAECGQCAFLLAASR